VGHGFNKKMEDDGIKWINDLFQKDSITGNIDMCCGCVQKVYIKERSNLMSFELITVYNNA
jgi:hypothetical protein